MTYLQTIYPQKNHDPRILRYLPLPILLSYPTVFLQVLLLLPHPSFLVVLLQNRPLPLHPSFPNSFLRSLPLPLRPSFPNSFLRSLPLPLRPSFPNLFLPSLLLRLHLLRLLFHRLLLRNLPYPQFPFHLLHLLFHLLYHHLPCFPIPRHLPVYSLNYPWTCFQMFYPKYHPMFRQTDCLMFPLCRLQMLLQIHLRMSRRNFLRTQYHCLFCRNLPRVLFHPCFLYLPVLLMFPLPQLPLLPYLMLPLPVRFRSRQCLRRSRYPGYFHSEIRK